MNPEILLGQDNYLKGYLGKADTKSVTVNDKGVRPEYTECRFVQISNFNVENEAAKPYSVPDELEVNTAGLEVYFGFNGTITRQVFPGDTTELIPISNLNQLILQTRPETERTVWLTYFW